MSKSPSKTLIAHIEKSYPALLRARDLIEMGLYPSRSAISSAIRKNQGPPFVRFGERKMRFPKKSLCDWIARRER
jgi:predicted DNA-binding transcriptional regulator AlpA